MSKKKNRVLKMANMSAQILRNIVSSVFNVKPTEVRLSGEIRPDYIGDQNINSSHVGYTWREEIRAFNPLTGFRQLDCVNTTHWWGGGQSEYTKGNHLAECLQDGDCFVVVRKSDDLNGDDPDKWYYTIYKLPNWKQYLADVESGDVARWEQWLSQ